LLGNKLSESQRKAAGLALVAVGAATTIPLAVGIIKNNEAAMAESNLKAA
jgi:hypothetical protein